MFANISPRCSWFPASPTKSDQCQCSGAPAWPFRIHPCLYLWGRKAIQKTAKGQPSFASLAPGNQWHAHFGTRGTQAKVKVSYWNSEPWHRICVVSAKTRSPIPSRQHRKHLVHILVVHWRTNWIPQNLSAAECLRGLAASILVYTCGGGGSFFVKKDIQTASVVWVEC